MSEELPQGWELIPLLEYMKFLPTGVEKYSGKIEYYSTGSIQDNIHTPEGSFTYEERPSRANRVARLKDVFQARMKETNKGLLITDALANTLFSTGFLQLRPYDNTYDNKLLFYYVRSKLFLDQRDELATGSTQEAITDTKAIDILIPFPPLAEQRRIVVKLEPLLGKVDACEKRLVKIQVILKRFRQSVLASACSGRLTEDWRENNHFSEETDVLENLPDGFPALPESWQWVRLESICDKIVDCPHSTPKWTHSGRLCLRTTNFKPGFLDLTEKQHVSDVTFEERVVRLLPHPGDVLYSREGGILGVACMIPAGVELCLGQRMMLFRTTQSYTNTLLMHWLNSPVILRHVQDLTGGSASPHLNVKDIKGFPTPIPPLPEQKEIVRRVEALFALADQIEARYAKAKTYVDKLTQSILAKAFRGELVPQDPNDEPASVLLEKIKTEKGRLEEAKKMVTKQERSGKLK